MESMIYAVLYVITALMCGVALFYMFSSYEHWRSREDIFNQDPALLAGKSPIDYYYDGLFWLVPRAMGAVVLAAGLLWLCFQV